MPPMRLSTELGKDELYKVRTDIKFWANLSALFQVYQEQGQPGAWVGGLHCRRVALQQVRFSAGASAIDVVVVVTVVNLLPAPRVTRS